MNRLAVVASLLLVPPVGVGVAKLAFLRRWVDVAAVLGEELEGKKRLGQLKILLTILGSSTSACEAHLIWEWKGGREVRTRWDDGRAAAAASLRDNILVMLSLAERSLKKPKQIFRGSMSSTCREIRPVQKVFTVGGCPVGLTSQRRPREALLRE